MISPEVPPRALDGAPYDLLWLPPWDQLFLASRSMVQWRKGCRAKKKRKENHKAELTGRKSTRGLFHSPIWLSEHRGCSPPRKNPVRLPGDVGKSLAATFAGTRTPWPGPSPTQRTEEHKQQKELTGLGSLAPPPPVNPALSASGRRPPYFPVAASCSRNGHRISCRVGVGSGGLGGTPSHPQRIVGCVPQKLCFGSWHL